MKKLLCLMILGLFVVSMVGVVSAKTLVAGTIYNEDYSEKIGGAEITVACSHDGDINYRYATSIPSGDSIGDYVVEYCERTGINCGEDDLCDDGDSVTVTATKENMSGSDTETVVNNMVGCLDIAIINVTIPEFGLFIGALTLLGAIGIFAFVRR